MRPADCQFGRVSWHSSSGLLKAQLTFMAHLDGATPRPLKGVGVRHGFVYCSRGSPPSSAIDLERWERRPLLFRLKEWAVQLAEY